MTRLPLRRPAAAALASLAVGAVLVATAGASWAQPRPATAPAASSTTDPSTSATSPAVVVADGTVTITLDTATVQARCAQLPAAQQRISALVARIQGGSDVAGSAASLTARAASARAAGQENLAARLDLRAQLRLSRVSELQQVSARLSQADASVCVPLAAQLGSGS
jgi:hypothetical protein